jgi:hypothetical protein
MNQTDRHSQLSPNRELENIADLVAKVFLRTTRQIRNGTVVFLTPTDGRFLPKPLAKEFEDAQCHPHVLFGDRIIISRLLGARAKQCLEGLKLMQQLTAADLVAHWDTGVVKDWLALFPDNARYNMLLGILQALVELDDKEAWWKSHRCQLDLPLPNPVLVANIANGNLPTADQFSTSSPVDFGG